MKPGACGITIRPAREADLEAIYEINRIGWEGVCVAQFVERRYGVVAGAAWQERKAGEVDGFCRAHLDRVLVAEAGGAVVGYATSWFHAADRFGEVCNNAVHPDWRGRGIATALIAGVIRRLLAEGAQMLRVTTLEQDVPAQRVYQKLGFRELGRSIMYTMSSEQATEALARCRGAACCAPTEMAASPERSTPATTAPTGERVRRPSC